MGKWLGLVIMLFLYTRNSSLRCLSLCINSTGSCGGFPSAAAGMPEMLSLHHATESGIHSEQCVG